MGLGWESSLLVTSQHVERSLGDKIPVRLEVDILRSETLICHTAIIGRPGRILVSSRYFDFEPYRQSKSDDIKAGSCSNQNRLVAIKQK